MLEEHSLALPVRADDEVMKCQRQFNNRVEARETPMTREHLFDEDARMSRSKKMDEPISRDGLRADFSCAFDVVHLSRFDPVEDRFRLREVIKRGIWHINYPY